MESNSMQLVMFQFAEHEFKILGTQEDPRIKCSDILMHLLGYKKSNDARWFRDMDEELKQMYIVMDGKSPSFNEQGIYWALMKSDKPVARQFQKTVCQILTSLRKQIQHQLIEKDKQLEQQRKRVEELEREQTGQIYGHTVYKDNSPFDGCVINVGQTLEYTRRFQQYERDTKALVESYKGREIIVAMAFFQINGYRIVGELFEKDIPQSELRPLENKYQQELQTLNCPRTRYPMEQSRSKVKCNICNREVLGVSMVSHLKTKTCIRHRPPINSIEEQQYEEEKQQDNQPE